MSAGILTISFISGFLFALGLCISGMINPQVVIGFLDVAGKWNPALLGVMGGALAVAAPCFYWILKQKKPLLGESFCVVLRHDADKKLILGAILFGIGWGLAGICPGPAITALASAQTDVFYFVLAMLAGMFLYETFGN